MENQIYHEFFVKLGAINGFISKNYLIIIYWNSKIQYNSLRYRYFNGSIFNYEIKLYSNCEGFAWLSARNACIWHVFIRFHSTLIPYLFGWHIFISEYAVVNGRFTSSKCVSIDFETIEIWFYYIVCQANQVLTIVCTRGKGKMRKRNIQVSMPCWNAQQQT